MKKIFMLLTVTGLIYGCGCSNNKNKQPGESAVTENADYQKGLALVTKNQCMTCHQVDDKLTGPPYREVADKYAGMPDTIVAHLARKIISGGSGVWGEIFMLPHPGVSQAEAEAMVKYILLLKK